MHSSKGNQLKWENNGIWYKADHTGYEGLAEYAVSSLLGLSSLDKEEYAVYFPEQIRYGERILNGTGSRSFLKDGWQIITAERLFQNHFGVSLHTALWTMRDVRERLAFLCDQIIRITGLEDFGKNKGLESRVVIIVDIDESCFTDDEKKRSFYVACSRATQKLALFINADDAEIQAMADAISKNRFAAKGKIAMKTQSRILELN